MIRPRYLPGSIIAQLVSVSAVSHSLNPQETILGSKITAVYRPFSFAHGRVMPLGRLASDAVLDAAYGWPRPRSRGSSNVQPGFMSTSGRGPMALLRLGCISDAGTGG